MQIHATNYYKKFKKDKRPIKTQSFKVIITEKLHVISYLAK